MSARRRSEPEFRIRAAEELARLRENSAVEEKLSDYAAMREQVRIDSFQTVSPRPSDFHLRRRPISEASQSSKRNPWASGRAAE